jgi:hypothetical protein
MPSFLLSSISVLTYTVQINKKNSRFIKNQAVNLHTNKRKMPQRFRYFLVVLLLMFAKENFAQVGSSFKSCEKKYIRCGTWLLNQDPPYKLKLRSGSLLYKANSDTVLKKQKLVIQYFTKNNLSEIFNYNNTEKIVFKNQYISSLGIICNAEYQFQKQTSIPLRLRVGSLDYTNYLEQKPNAVKPLY